MPQHAKRSILTRVLRREDGFTLTELLVSIVLLGVLVTAFSDLVASTIKHTARVTDQSVSQTQVRAAVNEIVSELRAAYRPSDTATSPFVGSPMSATTITYYTPDRLYSTASPTAFHLNEVTYQLTSGNLQRAYAASSNTSGPPWTLGAFGSWVTRVGSIQNTDIFTYYDSTGTATTNPASVASIVVKLTVKTANTPNAYTYSNSATLRLG